MKETDSRRRLPWHTVFATGTRSFI